MNTEYVIEVTDQNFQAQVLERSMHVPVVVDFWAPWCGPCRSLGPVLEKLAQADGGRWILAKINTDENPGVAQALQIRGIPAVKAIVQGRLVDEFTGARPEPAVRQWLDSFLPPAQEQAPAPPSAAEQAMMRGDSAGAEAAWRAALEQDPADLKAAMGLARLALERGQVQEAQALVDGIPEEARGRSPEALATLELIVEAAGQPPVGELQRRLAASGDDLEARYGLGLRLLATGQADEGLAELLEVFKKDRQWSEEAARKAMVKGFEALGVQSDLTVKWRKRLGAWMYV